MTFNVAVVGATGAVGRTILKVLYERRFPCDNLFPLASANSVGDRVCFNGNILDVRELDSFNFSNVHIAFFSAGASISKKYVPRAVESGCVVIDNTSQYRNEDDIPLVVPEINGDAISLYKKRGIVANPNCSTTQMAMVIKPLHDIFHVLRVNVVTYQAVSGMGSGAVNSFKSDTSDAIVAGTEHQKWGDAIAFNVVPHIGDFEENGYTKEEMKMVWETRKILNEPEMRINPTTARVPVINGHSMAIHIEFKSEPDIIKVHEVLNDACGVSVVDEVGNPGYPTVVTDSNGEDGVFVGRIRGDISHSKGLNMWVVADNLRKGAATNSVQIAECLHHLCYLS